MTDRSMMPAKGGHSYDADRFCRHRNYGHPIAGCLIRAGHALSIPDRRPEAMAALCAWGAIRADSAFAAARDSEVVFTSLPGPTEFRPAMLLEPQTGILAGLQPGAAHIDLTATRRRPSPRVAEACRSRGVELIDAPVGSRSANDDHHGQRQRRGLCQIPAVFEAVAANVFHVGPSGAATAKLVTQYLGYTNFIASIEGMLVAAGQDRPRDPGADRAGRRQRGHHVRQYRARRIYRNPSPPALCSTSSLRTSNSPVSLRVTWARGCTGRAASDLYSRRQAGARASRSWPAMLEAMAGTELRAGKGRRRMSDDRIARRAADPGDRAVPLCRS